MSTSHSMPGPLPRALTAALLSCAAFAAPLAAGGAEPSTPETAVRLTPDSRNQIMKFTEDGLSPQALTTNKADSIVFFLNQTNDSLTTLEIDYGGKRMHCASSALKLGDDGRIRSARPFGPRSFASACFPDTGSYKVTVYGLKHNPLGVSGTITVE